MNHYIFFPPGPGSLGVNVLECGHQKRLPGEWRPARRVFNCHVLSYIARGSAWYESASARRQFMPQGSCVVIFPGIRSLYSPCSHDDWEEYWIHFQGPVSRLLESEGILRPDRPVYRLHHSASLLNMFRESVRIALDRSEKAQKRLSGRLLHILNEVLLLEKDAACALPVGRVPLLVKRIRQNPSEKWDFHALAGEMKVTYPSLVRQFRKAAAKPPHQFVNIERMKLACQFLARGLAVHETCARVGMEDPFHFSRLFKQIMGKAPLNYRLMARNSSDMAFRASGR